MSSSFSGFVAGTGAGTTWLRRPLCDERTPEYRVTWRRGGGTSAANRAVRANGQAKAQAEAQASRVGQHVGPLAHAQHSEQAQGGCNAQKGALEATHGARAEAPLELQSAQQPGIGDVVDIIFILGQMMARYRMKESGLVSPTGRKSGTRRD